MVLPSYSSSSSQAFLLWPFFATRITWRIKASRPLHQLLLLLLLLPALCLCEPRPREWKVGHQRQSFATVNEGRHQPSVSHTRRPPSSPHGGLGSSGGGGGRLPRRPAFTLAWPFGIKRRFLHKRPFAIFGSVPLALLQLLLLLLVLLLLGLCLAIVVVQHHTTTVVLLSFHGKFHNHHDHVFFCFDIVNFMYVLLHL